MSAKAALAVAAFLFLFFLGASFDASAKAKARASNGSSARSEKSDAHLETYKDLINKAQNLTLQRDRLQTSQVLTRGIQRETKGTQGYKELIKALDELTSVFYTEKAHTLFALAESLSESRPKEALEPYLEALRIEDGNISLLKSIARVHLSISDCDKADAVVRTAENMNAYAPEVKLLRLQILDCQKNFDLLATKLVGHESDLEGFEKFSRGLQIKEWIRRKDFKKARSILAMWEGQMPDYPEVHFWKWKIADLTGARDRGSAVKYTQLCQNMTPRKRKSYVADVNLCKGKDAADVFLKESGFRPSSPTGEQDDD